MKPEIGTKVYCIYQDSILIENVEFLGAESFLIESFGCGTYEDSWEWYYEDYETEWFTDSEKAKEELRSRVIERYDDENFDIIKVEDDYYELDWREA